MSVKYQGGTQDMYSGRGARLTRVSAVKECLEKAWDLRSAPMVFRYLSRGW
jgi:hypothetical protein